jgi:hypothetical protein
LHFLIDQIPNFKREDLYPILQQVSFDLKNKTPEGFRLSLKKSLEAQNIHIDLPLLNKDGIKKIYLKHTDEIFQRFEN